MQNYNPLRKQILNKMLDGKIICPTYPHFFFNNEQHTNMTVTVILEMCTDICHLCPELKNGTLCVSFFAILFKIASFQIFQFIKRFLIFLAFRLSFSK